MTMQGCVPLVIGAAAGAGGITFVKGKLEKNFDYSVEKVHKASLAAIKSLDLFVRSDELSRHLSVTKGEFDDGKGFNVTITALTERASKIVIRVGLLGDQAKSEMILEAIEKKL